MLPGIKTFHNVTAYKLPHRRSRPFLPITYFGVVFSRADLVLNLS